MGQGLHVLHQGRRAAQAALAHPRGLERGQRGTAAEPVHQRRFLAGQEPRRGLRNRHAEAVQAARGSFGQRPKDLRARRGVQVQVRFVGADRLGGQLQPVEHEVRRDPQQQFILAAGRLALRAVGDDHLPAAAPGHDGHLPVHREGRAAPAGQAGGLDVTDQHSGPPPVRRGAVPGEVAAQVFRCGRQQAGQPGSLPGCPAWCRFADGRGHRDTVSRVLRACLLEAAVCCAKTAATRAALGTWRAA